MTTIATRSGIIAADTQVTWADHLKGFQHKIHKLPNGDVVAVAGEFKDELKLKEWLLNGGDQPKTSKNFEAIVYKEGVLWYCGRHMILAPIEGEYYAIGTGWELAMAAMAKGASAEEAVKFAATMDIYTSEPVETYDTKIEAGQATNKGRKVGKIRKPHQPKGQEGS